ncbi:unnamed protein product, partial [Meganyctiphanes norvegica]
MVHLFSVIFSGPLTEVVAVVGGSALLPCDVSTPVPGDAPILVLVYSGARGTPIYSIDSRNGPFSQSSHWSDPDLGSRAQFDAVSSPSGLIISSVDLEDEGDYRCRVDFRASPTKNLRVKLRMITPPQSIAIRHGQDDHEVRGVVGPFPMGSTVSLSCAATGGIPRPVVSWWNNGKLLDNVSEVNVGDTIINSLTLPQLSRHHLYQQFTCQAANTNLSVPIVSSVTLDLSFPPDVVSILGSNEALSVTESYSVVCEARGSRPAAVINWLKNGHMLTDTTAEVLSDGNVTRSTLHIHPSSEDNGAVLTCQADNPKLPGSAIDDVRTLKVYYAPKLSIKVGSNLDIMGITEGDDVYFECQSNANPAVYNVKWFLNGEVLMHNQSAGVIQINQSLVLQRVTRIFSGIYTCQATNIEGTGDSNAVKLNVKFLPVCYSGQKFVYGGSRHEEVNITCQVESYPPAFQFRWALNTSMEVTDVPKTRSSSIRSTSTLTYTPHDQQDFGTMMCWAMNELGQQEKPCYYQIVQAGVPEAVSNCSVSLNNSALGGAIEVECESGWSGGIRQTFTLEVHSMSSITSLSSSASLALLQQQDEPYFTVSGLKPGTEYKLLVYAENSQGRSRSSSFSLHTPIDVAERQTSANIVYSQHMLFMSPIFGILLGVVLALVVCCVVLSILLKMRGGKRASTKNSHNPIDTKVVYDKVDTQVKSSNDVNFAREGLASPDIILVTPGKKLIANQSQHNRKHFTPYKINVSDKDMFQQYISAKEASLYINPGSLLNNHYELITHEESERLLQESQLYNIVSLKRNNSPILQSSLGGSDSISNYGRLTPSASSITSSLRSGSIFSSRLMKLVRDLSHVRPCLRKGCSTLLCVCVHVCLCICASIETQHYSSVKITIVHFISGHGSSSVVMGPRWSWVLLSGHGSSCTVALHPDFQPQD